MRYEACFKRYLKLVRIIGGHMTRACSQDARRCLKIEIVVLVGTVEIIR